jgi:tetratricopeptide (TPR) repeat protein
MTRDNKRQKKFAKKAAKRKSQAVGRQHGISTPAPTDVRLISYEIAYEPLPEAAYDRLPESVKDQLDGLHNELMAPNPKDRLVELLALIERYPDVPQIYNFLYTTYERLNDQRNARRVLEETLERFPDYLFGRIAYAAACLQQGETEKVPEIFENCFELQLLYPERQRFHISEVLGFHSAMAWYFCVREEPDVAKRYYELMRELEPDNPRTKFVKDLLRISRLGVSLKQLLAKKT